MVEQRHLLDILIDFLLNPDGKDEVGKSVYSDPRFLQSTKVGELNVTRSWKMGDVSSTLLITNEEGETIFDSNKNTAEEALKILNGAIKKS